MKLSTVSSAVSSVYGLSALETLRGVAGHDKQAKHALIVQATATILALALADVPPKGVGTPADWKRIASIFTDANLKSYAEHSAQFSVLLKGQFRSVAAWAEALEQGFTLAEMVLSPCAPKLRTAEQVAASEKKKAAKKKQAAADEKAAAALAREVAAAEEASIFQRGFAAGVASVAAPVLSAQMVADMIRSGSFGADVSIIREALAAPVAAPVLAIAG